MYKNKNNVMKYSNNITHCYTKWMVKKSLARDCNIKLELH